MTTKGLEAAMAQASISTALQRELEALGLFVTFMTQSRWSERMGEPGICDFMLGNPHEGVTPGFTEALTNALPPQRADWHAYKMSEPESCRVVAASLATRTGIPFEPGLITMTNGAFAGLTISLRAILEPGDEVIYSSPPWFFYETIIRGAGGVPVKVHVQPQGFDLDLSAIENAITARTRAIIVNSPHNPTGKIVPAGTLQALAEILRTASGTHDRPIYILSDEAYSRVVFDGRRVPTPAAVYDRTLVIYTYGKQLLTPGERIGFVALPPGMPDHESLLMGLLVAQIQHGYAFPNALLQHSLADLDRLSIDLDHLQRKRDRVAAALTAMDYEVTIPEATFYMLVRVPGGDDWSFSEGLAEDDLFVLPGKLFDMAGYFRLSLTASDDMIDRALPIFEAHRSRIGSDARAEVAS
jgi:aspartate aminotransferase